VTLRNVTLAFAIRGLVSTAAYLLGAFFIMTSATYAAETAANLKHYSFGLHTLNQPDKMRRKQVQFSIDSGMTEDELDSVNHTLDALGASPVDADGSRELALSNGTRVKISGFLTEGFLEDSVEGVHSLPLEFAVKESFSPVEAALVLKLAAAGHLFIGSSIDADSVATTVEVRDRPFRKAHKTIAVTQDEKALAEWIQQNIPAGDAADEAPPQP
jgi:hypothetical protein